MQRFVSVRFLSSVVLLAGMICVYGQTPTPPKTYDVTIRYRIFAGRNERLAQYYDMVRYLKSIGFVPDANQDDDPRDPNETRLIGTIPSSVDRKAFFLDPHIEAVQLAPAGYKLPENPTTPVKVQLELTAGLSPDRQRVFADQVRTKLQQIGFKEAVGYDHRGHTRLVGLIPTGDVAMLLQDLRWQPSGWLAPESRLSDLPTPLRNVSPIRIVKILPEPEGVAAPTGWGPKPDVYSVDSTQKISPAIRDKAGKEDARERFELFLTYAPGPDDNAWRQMLTRYAPGLVIEGRLGTMVTLVASFKDLPTLAQLPMVSGIRLPRPAVVSLRPANDTKSDPAVVLRDIGLSNLHAQGHRGRGVRVAIIDGDFRGWERFRGKELPASVRHLDLTAERNPTLEADPLSGDPNTVGSGTQSAVTLALAAPEAEITLIRIDPAAPYQLEAAAQLIRGERVISESLAQRNAELRADADTLRRRRQELNEERRQVLNDFGQNAESVQRRQAHAQKAALLDSDEKAWQGRQIRYLDLIEAQRALAGIDIVSSNLVWESGYPVNGDGPLTRFFSDAPPCRSLWFQSAGNSRGQTWAGLFRDADGNGVMEFAAPETALPQGLWARELNFLGWQPHAKDPSLDLPEKLKLRLSIQWREAHDPSLYNPAEDPYRRPLTELRVVVLRQRDPNGKQVGGDEFDVVTRTEGLAQRIDNTPSSATYEQVVEFPADQAGRYAVRIEGRLPIGIRPPGIATLPIQRQDGEIYPRLHVEAAEASDRLAGRPVFVEFPTNLGGIGTPADSDAVYTVGAVNGSGQPQASSNNGPPLGRALLLKPNIWTYDGIALDAFGPATIYGIGVATPLAAGASAAMLSSGMPPPRWECYLNTTRGQVLRLP